MEDVDQPSVIGPFPITIVPNQSRKMDTLFQQWLSLSETQNVLFKEVEAIDQALGLEYQQTVLKEIKNLVEQISDMSVDLSEQRIGLISTEVNNENLVPPRSPRRRRPSGSGMVRFT
jgi:hypothetical protein